jgi:hypothetical protein
MSDPSTRPPSSVERWVSWIALFGSLALGWVLLWALGWSIDVAVDDSDGLAHAMTRDPCPRPDYAMFLLVVGMASAGVAGVALIARAMHRGGWWQIGLWVGFILIADALLMFQYVRLVPNPPCNFD